MLPLSVARLGQCDTAAEVFRDPIINFAHGGRADFRGRHNALYNFLSAPGLSVNVKMEEAVFLAHHGVLTVNGTFITEAHITAKLSPQRLATASFWASELDPNNFGWRVVNGSCVGRAFKFGNRGKKDCFGVRMSMGWSSATFELGNWTVTVKGMPSCDEVSNHGTIKAQSDVNDCLIKGPAHRIDVGFTARGDAPARDMPHGIIGQSFATPGTVRNGKQDVYPFAGDFTTSALAEGAIEGTALDYEMHNAFATEFVFSRFNAEKVIPAVAEVASASDVVDASSVERVADPATEPERRRLSEAPCPPPSAAGAPPPPPPPPPLPVHYQIVLPGGVPAYSVAFSQDRNGPVDENTVRAACSTIEAFFAQDLLGDGSANLMGYRNAPGEWDEYERQGSVRLAPLCATPFDVIPNKESRHNLQAAFGCVHPIEVEHPYPPKPYHGKKNYEGHSGAEEWCANADLVKVGEYRQIRPSSTIASDNPLWSHQGKYRCEDWPYIGVTQGGAHTSWSSTEDPTPYTTGVQAYPTVDNWINEGLESSPYFKSTPADFLESDMCPVDEETGLPGSCKNVHIGMDFTKCEDRTAMGFDPVNDPFRGHVLVGHTYRVAGAYKVLQTDKAVASEDCPGTEYYKPNVRPYRTICVPVRVSDEPVKVPLPKGAVFGSYVSGWREMYNLRWPVTVEGKVGPTFEGTPTCTLVSNGPSSGLSAGNRACCAEGTGGGCPGIALLRILQPSNTWNSGNSFRNNMTTEGNRFGTLASEAGYITEFVPGVTTENVAIVARCLQSYCPWGSVAAPYGTGPGSDTPALSDDEYCNLMCGLGKDEVYPYVAHHRDREPKTTKCPEKHMLRYDSGVVPRDCECECECNPLPWYGAGSSLYAACAPLNPNLISWDSYKSDWSAERDTAVCACPSCNPKPGCLCTEDQRRLADPLRGSGNYQARNPIRGIWGGASALPACS